MQESACELSEHAKIKKKPYLDQTFRVVKQKWLVITRWSSELSGPETWMTLPLLSRICFSHLESSAALKVIQNIQQWISSNVMSKHKASQYMADSSTPLRACWASHGHLSTSLLDPPPICRLQASFHLGSSQIPRDISEKRKSWGFNLIPEKISPFWHAYEACLMQNLASPHSNVKMHWSGY